MKDKIFGVLQRVGRSLMLPISILPVAGLLLGIGASFTNKVTIEEYGLSGIIYEGGIVYTILDIMKKCGSVVFDNIALLFAMGVAIGMAKKEKGVAALAGVLSCLVMNTTISVLIASNGGAESMASGTVTEFLGITTLQMGAFGGIIVGLGVAALHNRFYNVKLPAVLSFFGGTRFVPIISTQVYLVVGILMYYVWPIVQSGISSLGNLITSSGYAGNFMYGALERALIPFGLHHLINMPLWQTSMGGEQVVDGVLVQGSQNIFFAELASNNVDHFSASATRFMAGNFPLMIFGLVGAAFAMYKAADTTKRKMVGSLFLSAALTSAITGITEPIEFTFLFVAPTLYVINMVYAGVSFVLMEMLNVAVGLTFSGGVIDMTLFGIMQGNDKTSWLWILPIGVLYFLLYFVTFYALIKKFDIKTPGREGDAGDISGNANIDALFGESEEDVEQGAASKPVQVSESAVSEHILAGLGGSENLVDYDCCATRLRVTVRDPKSVSEDELKKSGAIAVIHKGEGVQIVYGPRVSNIKNELDKYLETKKADASGISLGAPLKGNVIPCDQIPDTTFASGVLGQGIGIDPTDGAVVAPFDGKVLTVAETGHAVGLAGPEGVELLIHAGVDTVEMKGDGFEVFVSEGDAVKAGQKLFTFDIDKIKAAGHSPITAVLITNSDDFSDIRITGDGETDTLESVITLKR